MEITEFLQLRWKSIVQTHRLGEDIIIYKKIEKNTLTFSIHIQHPPKKSTWNLTGFGGKNIRYTKSHNGHDKQYLGYFAYWGSLAKIGNSRNLASYHLLLVWFKRCLDWRQIYSALLTMIDRAIEKRRQYTK